MADFNACRKITLMNATGNNPKIKIVLLDFHSLFREGIRALLADQTHIEILGEASHLESGISIIKQEKPDLITLDIAMPSQSGMRTFRMFKDSEELKSIPVIIITGMGENVSSFIKRLKGFSSQPEGFMGKPIDEEKLIKMVSDLI